MRAHDTFLQLAAMAIDEPLSPSDDGRLELHLGGCAACAREVALLREDAREFAELAVPPLPGRRGDEILAAALHPRVDIHPVRLLALAALLGILLVGSLAVGSQLLRRDDDLSLVLPIASETALPSETSLQSPATSPSPILSPEPPGSPSPSPGFVLHAGTATGGCDAIGLEYQSLTWRIDPAADEPVTAVTNTGETLLTAWAPGFTAGSADEQVIRDPAGVVVVRDGDVLRVGDRLNGYYVCLGLTNLSVFTQDPG